MKITSKGGRRYYTHDGKKYPSITTVLSILNKDAIMRWRARVGEAEANRISSESLKVGRHLHRRIEEHLQSKQAGSPSDEEDGRAVRLLDGMMPDLDRIGNIRALELPMYSSGLGVAGTTDCIADFDGSPCVIDFKNSRRPKTEEYAYPYYLQAAAYSHMWEEQTGERIDDLCIIIGVWDDTPQVLQASRSDYTRDLLDVIRRFNE
ncbi:conserved hypothetical protein [Cenarchaeum symbiosum A]|uniref:Uncharacterized protein n=1 Tax=Cenarchaeum symbiosum (strain A) TaxID=414004 RepID=A0RVD7_CENSY|nr:conserved hypothetical protein [Cenarchaeum symbiosum A]